MKPVHGTVTVFFCVFLLQAKAFCEDYAISASEYPKVPTAAVMETDTTSKIAVTIGPGGKDQAWNFTQPLAGSIIPNDFVAPAAAYCGSIFTNAGWAVQARQYLEISAYPPVLTSPMVGFFEANYFERVEGDNIYGIGLSMKTPLYSGGGAYVKQALNYAFPLALGKKWLRDSQFNFPVSVVYYGMPLTVTVALKDSAMIEVDATGKLTLPAGIFDCVRLKLTRTVSLWLNMGGLWSRLEQRTVPIYQWYTKNAGLLLEVTGHPGETNPNFTEAALVVRMLSSSATAVDCGPGCGSEAALPSDCAIGQNYPNPFNPSTRIPYSLQTASTVDMRVYDLMGREIAVLAAGFKPPGPHETAWNGRDRNGAACQGGMYFCRMKATPVNGSQPVVLTRKMLLTN